MRKLAVLSSVLIAFMLTVTGSALPAAGESIMRFPNELTRDVFVSGSFLKLSGAEILTDINEVHAYFNDYDDDELYQIHYAILTHATWQSSLFGSSDGEYRHNQRFYIWEGMLRIPVVDSKVLGDPKEQYRTLLDLEDTGYPVHTVRTLVQIYIDGDVLSQATQNQLVELLNKKETFTAKVRRQVVLEGSYSYDSFGSSIPPVIVIRLVLEEINGKEVEFADWYRK